MARTFVCVILLGVVAFASPAFAQNGNGDGNGGLSGPHYNLNIQGKDNCSGDD